MSVKRILKVFLILLGTILFTNFSVSRVNAFTFVEIDYGFESIPFLVEIVKSGSVIIKQPPSQSLHLINQVPV
jgi:hypothetical protein